MHAATQATAGPHAQPFPPSLAAMPMLPGIAPVHAQAQSVTTTEGIAPAVSPVPSGERTHAGTGALSGEQEALLMEHLSLVRYVARGIAERLPAHVELDELMSAGMVGLLDAARKYKAGKGVQFRSYAQFRIRGAILDSLRALDWSPRELRRRARGLAQARHTLESRLGRPGTETEVAEEMGIPLAAVQQLAASLRTLEVTPLSSERSEDSDEQELAFVPAKESENPLLQYLEGESRQRVLAALDALPERERLVMRLYYFEEMTMREIGEVLGVVESRISQIHQETLRRLRSGLACLRRPAAQRPPVRSVA